MINIDALKEAIIPGIRVMARWDELLELKNIPRSLKHLRMVVKSLSIRTVGGLMRLPNRIEVEGGRLYETKIVHSGREYPQGWGRGPGGAEAETPPESDRKVDVFRLEDNANMAALKADIAAFIEML